MAGSLNRVTLIGNLGSDPDVKTTPQGSRVANFSIATTESYRDKNSGENRESTEWHRLSMWDGLADIAQKYLKKGNKIYVEGKIKSRSYEQDGVTKYITEILVQNLIMLGGASGNQSSQGGDMGYVNNMNKFDSSDSPNNISNSDLDDDDDVPF